MTREDLRLFCLMLGFSVIVAKGDNAQKHGFARATSLAELIESFCLTHIPRPDGSGEADSLIEEMKNDLRGKGDTSMEKNRLTLLALYTRLAQRTENYAGDDVLANLVLGLLDAEIHHEDSHKTRIS